MQSFKDLTVLVAHPDDELLFLWPFLLAKDAPRAKRIVCVVSDRDNIQRGMPNRATALKRVGDILGVSIVCLEADSDFYKTNPRGGELRFWLDSVLSTPELKGSPIATHNPWGEYGHLDHVLLHLAVRGAPNGYPVYSTDICSEAPGRWFNVYAHAPGERQFDAELDRELFDRCRAVYVELGCWTWAWEPVECCGVYQCV